jgi:hypothetical protein
MKLCPLNLRRLAGLISKMGFTQCIKKLHHADRPSLIPIHILCSTWELAQDFLKVGQRSHHNIWCTLLQEPHIESHMWHAWSFRSSYSTSSTTCCPVPCYIEIFPYLLSCNSTECQDTFTQFCARCHGVHRVHCVSPRASSWPVTSWPVMTT